MTPGPSVEEKYISNALRAVKATVNDNITTVYI